MPFAESMLLYAVTDRAWLNGRTLADCVQQAIEGGATFVQLREKDAPIEEIVELARELLPHLPGGGRAVRHRRRRRCGAGLRGRWRACRAGRHGLRRGAAALGPDAIVGVSAQTVGQALQAQADGADYLGVGALIPTPTKPDAVDVTFDELRAICEAVDIPVVGIGGLNARTIPQLAGSGADGAAVVSAIFAADDCKAASCELESRARARLRRGR